MTRIAMPDHAFTGKGDMALVSSLLDNFSRDLSDLHSVDRKIFVSGSISGGSWLALYFPTPVITLMVVATLYGSKCYYQDRPDLAANYSDSIANMANIFSWVMASATAQDLAHPTMVKFMTEVCPHLPADLINRYWTEEKIASVKTERAGVDTSVKASYASRAVGYVGSFFMSPAPVVTPEVPLDPYVELMTELKTDAHERTMEYCLYGQTGELLNHAVLHRYSLDVFLRKALEVYHLVGSFVPAIESVKPKV